MKDEHNLIVNNNSNQLLYQIGCCTDRDVRFKSSSGGIGTAIIKYLLDTGAYGTAMTFEYDNTECQYRPKLIYNYKDYNNCGSIYQDTDTIGFVRRNIDRIRDGIIITCMPCQVKAIKSILSRRGIRNFIVSLCCSGQTTIYGTWYYYKLLGIRKEDVNNIQYRGNGWPSGIQINLKNGDLIKKNNYTYPWTLMHKSLLFRPKRCLYCTMKTTKDADVSLADPWLREYIENDNEGNSVIICNEYGEKTIKQMETEGILSLKTISEAEYIESQLGTIEEKAKSNKYKRFNKIIASMGKEDSVYKRIVVSSVYFMKMHLRFLKILRIVSRI